MKKPLLICCTALLVTSLIIAQSNSLFYVDGYQSMEPNHPVTDPIVITVFPPTNQSVYFNTNNITIEFNVTKPDSWFDSNYLFVGIIQEIYYSLDGNRSTIFKPDLSYNWYTDGLPKTSQYSIALGNLSQGMHNITVAVNATTYWMRYSGDGTFQDYQYVSLPAYSTIQFNIVPNNPSPTMPEFPALMILTLLLSIFSIVVVLRLRKSFFKTHQYAINMLTVPDRFANYIL